MEEIKSEVTYSNLDAIVKEAVMKNLNRTLIKKIDMPLFYRKTQHSAAEDIHSFLNLFIQKNESYKVAGVLYKFWDTKFLSIAGLMRLFNQIGWFAAKSMRGLCVMKRIEYPLYRTIRKVSLFML